MTENPSTPSIGRRSILTGVAAATAAAGLGSATAAQAKGPSSSGPYEPGPAPLSPYGRELIAAAPTPTQKWDIEGNALRYRGTTFVYPVPQDSAFFEAGKEAMSLLAGSRYSRHFAIVPHTSLHMTLFSVVNDSNRPTWPTGFDRDAHLTHAVQRVISLLHETELDIPQNVTMKVTGIESLIDASAPQMKLTGATDEIENGLRRLRRQLGEMTGIAVPSPDTYSFHSTLAYRLVAARRSEHRDIQRLEDRILDLFTGEAATVTMEPAAFTPFDDMLSYPQVHLLV